MDRRAMLARLFGVALAACSRTPQWPPTPAYTVRVVAGFRVLVSPRAMHEPRTEAFLGMIETKLVAFRAAVRAEAFDTIKGVSLWVELDERDRAMAGYHGADWVRRRGLNPDKAGAIEIADRDAFWTKLSTDGPWAVAHELAHAYLDRASGDEAKAVSRELRLAFDAAVASGRYGRAYAMESAPEYFAESTESYLGSNDFEPLDRRQLEAFDPAAFSLMRRVWG